MKYTTAPPSLIRTKLRAGFQPVQDGRIYIERAGLDLAVAGGWLLLHESGTFVKLTQSGADLLA